MIAENRRWPAGSAGALLRESRLQDRAVASKREPRISTGAAALLIAVMSTWLWIEIWRLANFLAS